MRCVAWRGVADTKGMQQTKAGKSGKSYLKMLSYMKHYTACECNSHAASCCAWSVGQRARNPPRLLAARCSLSIYHT